MLIEHLPPESAFHRQVAGHTWRDVEYLLAIVADRLGENTYVTARSQGGGRSMRRPKPLPRPGDTKDRLGDRGERSTEEVVTYLDQYKPRQSA